MRTRRRVAMLVVLVVLLLATAAPAGAGRTAPRCKVQTLSGVPYLVCPCKGVSYQCEDWWGPIRRWRR